MNKTSQATQAKRQRRIDPLSVYRVFNRLQPFTQAELMQLELPIRISFESLRNGTGAESDFHDLAAAINVTLVRCEQINPLAEQAAIDARDALMRSWHRWQTVGLWGFDGPALAQVEAGIYLHEQLIRMSTPEQMMQAGREVRRRGAMGEVAA